MANHTEFGMNVISKDGSRFEPWAHDTTDMMMPKVVKALGGQEVVDSLPLLDLGDKTGSTGYLDFVSPKMMPAPIMKGVDGAGRPFIALRLQVIHTDGETELVVEVLQRRYTTGSVWTSGGSSLICAGAMTDADVAYLTRLIKGEDVGRRSSSYLGMNPSDSELEAELNEVKARGGKSIIRSSQVSNGKTFYYMSWEMGEIKVV